MRTDATGSGGAGAPGPGEGGSQPAESDDEARTDDHRKAPLVAEEGVNEGLDEMVEEAPPSSARERPSLWPGPEASS